MLEGDKDKNICYRCGDVMSFFFAFVAQNRTNQDEMRKKHDEPRISAENR